MSDDDVQRLADALLAGLTKSHRTDQATDEAFDNASEKLPENLRMVFANLKRTYDTYQEHDLTTKTILQAHLANVFAMSEQNIQNGLSLANKKNVNSAETDNMVAKQAHRHSDLSIDRQWNVDEVASYITKYNLQQDAIADLLVMITAKAAAKE